MSVGTVGRRKVGPFQGSCSTRVGFGERVSNRTQAGAGELGKIQEAAEYGQEVHGEGRTVVETPQDREEVREIQRMAPSYFPELEEVLRD